jgi:hypothetical protein
MWAWATDHPWLFFLMVCWLGACVGGAIGGLFRNLINITKIGKPDQKSSTN